MTSLTEPTSSPWYFTSDWLGRPSPTLCKSATTRTYSLSRPVDLYSRVAVTAMITAKMASP
ncbi:hypothetical protein C1Y40_03778 [Mycobacterium talmoniae]|uniref:Uncharacterized protein n=1 Tax=Mycobacterium talmoniae TaxID=1858794 RepID=A0A2S8BHB2_9MYCO|nr:hypothetical protein C1Y40_03778 [Mycobacterium talmoniae]